MALDDMALDEAACPTFEIVSCHHKYDFASFEGQSKVWETPLHSLQKKSKLGQKKSRGYVLR